MNDYMKPPYTVDLSDSIADDESDCWVIDNDRGSVAEITCPFEDAEATARFLARAGNAHQPLVEALRLHMQWIGPPPIDRESFDSLREDAWRKGKAALDLVDGPKPEANQ